MLINKIKNIIEKENDMVYTKISELKLDMFSMNIHGENKNERRLLLDSMTRKSLGKQVSKPLLKKLYKDIATEQAI